MNWLVRLYQGRMGRMEFFVACVFVYIIQLAIFFVFLKFTSTFLISDDGHIVGLNPNADALLGLYLVACALFLLLTAHLEVRRLHDIGLSGWWFFPIFLIGNAPVIGGIASILIRLYLFFVKGADGDNKYGPPPDSNRTYIRALLNY